MNHIKTWETKVVQLCDVVPQDKNPRIIDPEALKGLKNSIGRFGLVELIVWNQRTRHIVSGHQRYSILMQDGVIETPMVVVDMSPEDELAASLTLNNPQIEGEFDEPIMELLSQVETSAPDLFNTVHMHDLKKSLEQSMSMGHTATENEETSTEPEWDTECPCCQHKFKVDAKDIVVVKGTL